MSTKTCACFGLLLTASMFAFACTSATSSSDESAVSSDQHLTGSVSPAIADACGGGAWLATSTFDGLEGSYERTNTAPQGALVSITFRSVVRGLGPRVDGSFSRTLTDGTVGTGTFEGLEDNAAFESNFLLTPSDASGSPDIYYALALKRSATGEISDLCIEHPVGTVDVPILLQRALPQVVDAGID